MILKATMIMGAIGLSLSLLLAVASRIFYVPEDLRLKAIKSVLPGLNCGACGYAGCEGAAKALLSGKAPLSICAMGGAAVIEQLIQITGTANGPVEIPVATPHCFGPHRIEPLFEYNGASDCRAAAMLFGGFNPCDNGCLGGGTCAAVCPFAAIELDADRRPCIDSSRCRGCGRCVEVCPRTVIRLETLSDQLLYLERTTDCLAPCSQKCPAQVDVPRFIGHLTRGEMERALLTIKMRNPLPLTVGRTCPHPCENICRRNIADEGVAIGHLERYLGQWEFEAAKRVHLTTLPDTGRQVAVVGGGPAGLSCAYFLRRLGHQPTIFDAKPHLGGMLRYGIPEYRLPREVVDWEIKGILELGMVVRTQTMLGRDFTLSELQQTGFEAIFLGLGAWNIPHLCVPGEAVEGVWPSLDFLSQVGRRLGDLRRKRVVVIGESNTAMDCARCSIRLGAETVTVIAPRDRQGMSARKRDVTRAEEEGVDIRFMTRPRRIVPNSTGRVQYVLCQSIETDSEKNVQKRCPPFPESSPATRLDADLVVVAYERKPDLACLTEQGADSAIGFKFTPSATLAVDSLTLLAARPNIFAAGDMHTGRASVIAAVAGGRVAARSIHHLITTGVIRVPGNLHCKVNPKSILKGITLAPGPPRVRLKELPVEIRRLSFTEEVVATITKHEARAETQRCLQCGSYCYSHTHVNTG